MEALQAWCAGYGTDRNFWAEKGFGGRVSAWLDQTFIGDATSATVLRRVKDELLKCLDVLITSGVPQAREIEQRITRLGAAS